MCLLIIFWSLADENHIFVVFNELIDVQNPQFTISRTTISKKMAIHKQDFQFFDQERSFLLKNYTFWPVRVQTSTSNIISCTEFYL